MYYPPSQPMYFAPSKTEKGIRQASYTMVLFLIVNVISIVVVAALIPVVSTVVAAPGDIDAILGTLLGLVAATCALAIIDLVGLILGLMAVLALREGRNEFPPEHGQKLDRAFIALAIGIALPIVGQVASGVVSASEVGLGGGLIPTTSVTMSVVSAAFGITGALFIGLFLLWAVDFLNTPQGRTRGLIALVLGAVAGVVSVATSIYVLVATPVLTDPTGNIHLLLIPSIIGGAISIVSILLWYLVYRGILERFKSGELRPAPPVPMYAAPFPPMYAPPYVPAYPPPQQPPAQPPSQPGTPPPNP